MKRALLSLLLAAVPAAAQYPVPAGLDGEDAYWAREFHAGQPTQQYNVQLECADPDKTESAVRDAAEKAGGRLTNMSGGGGQRALHWQGKPRRFKHLSYQFPAAKAEAAARRISELGRLKSYSYNGHGADALADVEERVAKLSRELKDNAAALEKMPAARALLRSKLQRLEAARQGMESGRGQAMVTVMLQSKAEGGED